MDKASEIKNVHKVVLSILEDMPGTRNSDDILYLEVCRKYSDLAMITPFEKVILNRKMFGIPPFETVRRTRQKIQSERTDLLGNAQNIVHRLDNEEVFREYARS